MNIELPLRAGDRPTLCEREKFDANDQHTPIFDAKQGCVAHVFGVGVARKMALAFNCHDELVAELRRGLTYQRCLTETTHPAPRLNCVCQSCEWTHHARAALVKVECQHNVMVATKDPEHAWQCANCGYVYGKGSP